MPGIIKLTKVRENRPIYLYIPNIVCFEERPDESGTCVTMNGDNWVTVKESVEVIQKLIEVKINTYKSNIWNVRHF